MPSSWQKNKWLKIGKDVGKLFWYKWVIVNSKAFLEGNVSVTNKIFMLIPSITNTVSKNLSESYKTGVHREITIINTTEIKSSTNYTILLYAIIHNNIWIWMTKLHSRITLFFKLRQKIKQNKSNFGTFSIYFII